MLFKSVYGLNT